MSEPDLKKTVTTILGSENGAEGIREMKALRDRAPLEALDAIICLLSASEETLRRRAGSSLSTFREHIGTRADILTEPLQHNSDARVRLSCAIAPMSTPTASVTLAHRRALEDPFDKVAQTACLEVKDRGGAEGTEALMRTPGHNSWRVRLEACKALISQGTGDRRIVETLRAILPLCVPART